MKVLTFSKVFPKWHINAGEPTYFKEKILSGLSIHTIRPQTSKWKIGDKISMRQWSGKPYNSKQEIFCEEFEVVEMLEFSIEQNGTFVLLTNLCWFGFCDANHMFRLICKNDGLTIEQFKSWFRIKEYHELTKEFKGTIIAWKPTNYKP